MADNAAFSIDPSTTRASRHHAAVARAFSHLLRATPEEAAFAIFGHWGRGKTFVAKEICQELQDKYTSVWFSAWRYQHPPECWAFLYETFVKALRQFGVVNYLCVSFRRNLIKYGILPLLILHFVFFFSVIVDITQKIAISISVVSFIGISASLLIVRFWVVGKSSISQISNKYSMLPSHQERLGLQEVLGSDIRMLITAWLSGKNVCNDRVIICILLLIAISVLLPIISIQYILQFDMNKWLDTAQGRIWIVWSFIYIVILSLLAYYPVSQKKILLIVDDLDRCDPSAALMIIESLVLLLDAKRADIQLIFLIDESSLQEAIVKKFSSRDEALSVRGHIEKLFTAYVRLPKLAPDDFGKIAGLLFRQDELNAAEAAVEAASATEKTAASNLIDAEKRRRSAEGHESKGPPATISITTKKEVPTRIPPKQAALYGMEPFEIVESTSSRQMSNAEKAKWLKEASAESKAARDAHVQSQAEVDKCKIRLEKAQNNLHVLRQKTDIFDLNKKIDFSELNFSDAERELLLLGLADLATFDKYDWGPRSAHVAFKKYYLLKALAISMNNHEGMPSDENLMVSMFSSIKNRLNIDHDLEINAPPNIKRNLKTLADYVA